MSERKSIQLILIWTTIISALVYFIGLEFVDNYAEAKLEEYDQDTTTSSDFTAIYKIPQELYENFVQNIYPVFNEFLYKTSGKSHVPVMAFKTFLQDGIEKQLSDEKDEKRSESLTPIMVKPIKSLDDQFFYKTEDSKITGKDIEKNKEEFKTNPMSSLEEKEMIKNSKTMKQRKSNFELNKFPSIQTDKTGINSKRTMFLNKSRSPSTLKDYFVKTKDIQIADIYFSFKNREILHLLAERGIAILDGQHEMKVMLEEDIYSIIKKDHKILTTPVSAFITFVNEESYLRATELNEVRVGSKVYYKKYWQGHPLFFKPALEPSSILWENQYVPQSEKVWKLFVSLLIVFLILFASFVFLFYAQKEIYDYMNIYPYIDCESILKTYGDSLEHYAVLEWTYLKETLHSKDLTSSTGTLS
jgi:hypothetical protein